MLVKCQICKKQIERETAYKRVVNGANKYYCSENEFNTEEERKQKAKADKDKVYRLICDILGVPDVINTILYKEWILWNKVKSNEIIAKYLEENKVYLTGAISRLSGGEYNKIRYLSAILKNSLGDYKPKVVEEKVIIPIQEEHYETKYKPKIKKSLDDIEGEYDE